ncbi:hypothetical protein ABL78_1741 [Leptomonas seymouri]|uniref:Uncharacterized protein n=1 Tax=Leptomonas seymouri TaxID=5684 RepID=A0A0N1I713_LEPSE|nr:hypothetical protein ABL78_1741 [Leptomonas seymouri]|eukprot:KPI89178.1 hypothetical protein ABL78_1741 [Leptomonas seymouri]
MEDSATGELPLHPHASDSSTFSYEDYWKALTASTRLPTTTEHASPRPLLVPGTPQGPAEHTAAQPAGSAAANSAPHTPTRFIHAATGAYRLWLSLSPSPTPPVPSPLSLKHPNSRRPTQESGAPVGERKPRNAHAASRHRARAPSSNPISTFGWDGSNGVLPRAHRESTCASSDTAHYQRLPANIISEELPLITPGAYAMDEQVLQAVRCYEAWRRCLCVEDADAKAQPTFNDVEQLSERDRNATVTSQSQVRHNMTGEDEERMVNAGRETSAKTEVRKPDAKKTCSPRRETEVELPLTPAGTLSSIHIPHVGLENAERAAAPAQRRHRRSLSLLAAIDSQAPHFSSPSSMEAADDRLSKSRSVHSNETYGLTNARAEKEASHGTSSAVETSAAAASPSPLVWSMSAPRAPFSVSASPLAQQQDKLLLNVPDLSEEVKARSADSHHLFEHELRPLAKEEHGGHAVMSVTETERGGAGALQSSSAVQRKLFAESDEEDNETEVDQEESQIKAATVRDHDTCTLREGGIMDQLLCTGAATPLVVSAASGTEFFLSHGLGAPPVETVIELSCSSSYSSSSSHIHQGSDTVANSSGAGSVVEQEDYAEPLLQQEMELEEGEGEGGMEQPLQSLASAGLRNACANTSSNLDGRSNVRPNGEQSRQPCTGSITEGQRTHNQLCEHPLYVKHHAAVSAFYSARLLESEKQNEELQLFLCWAQEKAERLGRLWQPATACEAQTKGDPRGKQRSPAADEVLLPRSRSSARSAADLHASAELTASGAVRKIWQRAYTQRLGPCLPSAHATSGTGGSAAITISKSAAPQMSRSALPPCQPAVHVAPPAASALREHEGQWLTPFSSNSRFIGWIASEVDVYADLLL